MGREVEHKFRVTGQGWRAAADSGVRYRQGYLSSDPERSVRVRVAGDRGFLTVKGRAEGARRDEFEYAVPKSDAEQLLELCPRPLIEKTRYTVRDGALMWEIDEFDAENRGLIVAEVEAENVPLTKPEWVGPEVTGDPRYDNLSLSKRPFSRWTAEEK